MRKVLVILGPTATGKTDLALSLAKKFNGELVACDSRQVYKGLDIGTGKEPGRKSEIKKHKESWEIDGITISMYDVADLSIQYTVKDYIEKATEAIENIISRGKLPIIVGGTGLYLKGLLYGFPNLSIPVDENLRRELEGMSLRQLQEKLKEFSPTRFLELNDSDQKNPRRLLRSIELIYMNPYKRTGEKTEMLIKKYEILKIGLSLPRQVLQERIDLRVSGWLDQGIVKEVEELIGSGIQKERFKGLGLEYAVITEYLDGKISGEEMKVRMQFKVRQYAKRQMTWFIKDGSVNWFDVTKRGWEDKVEKKVGIWYHAGI